MRICINNEIVNNGTNITLINTTMNETRNTKALFPRGTNKKVFANFMGDVTTSDIVAFVTTEATVNVNDKLVILSTGETFCINTIDTYPYQGMNLTNRLNLSRETPTQESISDDPEPDEPL